MKKSEKRKTYLKAGLLLAFLFLATLVFLFLDNKKQQRQEYHLQLVTEKYAVFSDFLFKDALVKTRIFQGKMPVNYKEFTIKGYLYDKNVPGELKKQFTEDAINPRLDESTIEMIAVNVNSGKAMSLYDSLSDRIVTTIPVYDPVSKEMASFVMIRSKVGFLANEAEYFRIVFFLSLLLMLAVFFTFYMLHNKRIILEANAELLEKKSKQFVDAQTIANLGHWEFVVASKELSWSDQIFRIFGFLPQSFEVTFEAFIERVHPDDREYINAAYADAIKNHTTYDVQHRILTRNGAEKWVREICSTEYDEDGEAIRSFGIVHDITEQHRSLALLEQKHEMFMHGPVVVFTWRNAEDWPVEYVSENVQHMFGFSAEGFLDGSVKYSDCIHSDDLQRVRDEVVTHSSAESNNFVHEPYRLVSRSGKSVWVLDSTSIVRDSHGIISHYQGYLVDVTQRMLMKDEVSESRTRLELIIDSANLGTWDWDVVTGNVVYNKRWAEIIGYTPEEINSDISTWKSIIHPDEMDVVKAKLTDHLEGRTSVYKAEHRIQHTSGKWVWVLDVGKVLERDEEGNPLRVVGILLDITENKEAVQTLLESKEQEYMQRYINAIDNMGLGVFVVDADYCVRDMNQTMIGWFGDHCGEICYESVAGRTSPCPYCRLDDVIVGGQTVHYQPVVTPDGRSFDIGGVPLVNLDGTVSKMEIIRDVTEQEQIKTDLLDTNSKLEEAVAMTEKMAEEAAEANRAKSVFLSTMGHELRTPLNAILGYSQAFSRDRSLSEKTRIGARTIQQSGEHLLLLLNDILDLSRVEAGKLELVKTEFQFPAFLQGIMDIIMIRARQKGLDCYNTAETLLPATIKADELRLRQVLLNLLSNAVKFTETGHCALFVSSHTEGKNKALLTFVVEDSGIGIVSGMQEKIFEVFQQSGQRLEYSEGYGLGLSISRRLVQLMGGELALTSPINKQADGRKDPGSQFSFSIEVGISGEFVETAVENRNSVFLQHEHSAILAPPQDILNALIQLAKSGDIDAIAEQSASIAQMEDGKYEEFASWIKQLVDKFQLIEIVSFISKYTRG